MNKSRQQRVADSIAKRIMENSRKRYGSLYADALQEVDAVDGRPNLEGVPGVRARLEIRTVKAQFVAPKDAELDRLERALLMGLHSNPNRLPKPKENK